jgi:hypothetical protein
VNGYCSSCGSIKIPNLEHTECVSARRRLH